MWQYTGQQRPDFAKSPGPGQESVWDYPRPPALVNCEQPVEVSADDVLVARSSRCMRVLETASPPTVYIPPGDIHFDKLTRVEGASFCEWKGMAEYWALADTGGQPIAWSYPQPKTDFAALRDWLCFYPDRVACYLDGERVRAQEGGFYGGWVTDAIVGPWKGAAGSGSW